MAAAVLLIGLAGCVVPAQTPDTTPRPSRSEVATVATVRLGTTGLTVLAKDGTKLATIPTSASPTDAVAELTKALGKAPVVTQTEANYCYASYTIDDWGGLAISHGMSYPLPAGAAFGFSSSGASVGNVRVEGPGGIAVGESGSSLLASTPASDVDRILDKGVESANVWVDLVPGANENQTGTRIVLPSVAGSAPIVSISGPDFRRGEC